MNMFKGITFGYYGRKIGQGNGFEKWFREKECQDKTQTATDHAEYKPLPVSKRKGIHQDYYYDKQ